MSIDMSRLCRRMALAGTLALVGTAVHAQDVGYNFMPGTDFTKYKTYRWVRIEGQQYPDDITDAQIKQAIDTQMVTKGLSKTEAETADIYIGYRVALDKEKQLNVYGYGNYGGLSGQGWGEPYRGYGHGGGITTATTSTITVGTLSLEMYDPPAKKLVWRGTASKTLDVDAKPEKRTKILNKAMAKMFKNYPPKEKT